jgi:NAD(P)-dependent dehydrogenase (short-subunit alcohol dehydrogenase family)
MARATDFFRNKAVLITGGSRGLGLLLAEEVGRLGAQVAICGRAPEAVERAERHLRDRGVAAFGRACDLADAEEAQSFVDEVAARLGRIDVVVNNAGVIRVGPIETVTLEKLHEVMAANFWSAVHVTLAALPILRESGTESRIVNVGSVGGRAGLPHMLGYDSSKFALTGFSEALRAELSARKGAPRVVTVVPGLMRTGSFYNAEFDGDGPKEFSWFSIGSSLPLVTIDGRRAARRIAAATADGRAFLRLGLFGYAIDWLRRLSPRATVWLMGLVARLLPRESGDGFATKGRLVDSALPGSMALRLGDRAARANNEMPPMPAR